LTGREGGVLNIVVIGMGYVGIPCAALVTRHREYETLDFQWMKDVMRAPALVDGRNVFDPVEYALVGFTVRALGKIGL
jgi:UDPglucose 6-dehydrogenase